MFDQPQSPLIPDHSTDAKNGGALIAVVITLSVAAVGASIVFWYHKYLKPPLSEEKGRSNAGNRLFRRRHKHQELSGVDEDELDEDIELGHEDDRRTRAQHRRTPKHHERVTVGNGRAHQIG